MKRILRAIFGAIFGFVLAAGIAVWHVRSAARGDYDVDPSQRARVLAEGISEAMNVAALLVVSGIVVGAALGALAPMRRPPNPPDRGV